MEQNDIIELLRNEKGNLQEKFGLISIGLFGSHAKGTVRKA
jgi:predicted nucleotidyltransferase